MIAAALSNDLLCNESLEKEVGHLAVCLELRKYLGEEALVRFYFL